MSVRRPYYSGKCLKVVVSWRGAPRKIAYFPTHAALALLAMVCFVGCGERPEAKRTDAAKPAPAAADAQPRGPAPNEKVCFVCQGEGTVPCRAPSCIKGQAECPGPCLKLTRGVWVRMNVPGHDPGELWQTFHSTVPGGTGMSWNHHHVGEVIAYQNGSPVNIGPCKTCGGSTKVACLSCKGSGKQTCEVCQGKKYIPASWTTTDNPWFNNQPDLIRLANGQAILGRIAATSGDDQTIVTRDKKILHVKSSDIMQKGSPNQPRPSGGDAK